MINRIGGSSWCSGNWPPLLLGHVILENHLPAFCLLILGLSFEIITYFLGPVTWKRGETRSFGPFGQASGMRTFALTCANNLCTYSSFPFTQLRKINLLNILLEEALFAFVYIIPFIIIIIIIVVSVIIIILIIITLIVPICIQRNH